MSQQSRQKCTYDITNGKVTVKPAANRNKTKGASRSSFSERSELSVQEVKAIPFHHVNIWGVK
ncbi:hypothetical protein H9655_12190 [Cytobacillus sp. Sa5YUA1]|uniref:Uncharacterized protein n=1 Tax=Cytobacillus stercorigallinarum TaxID=2762240 RepID=A0ABR8QQR8_9BACI|nr:hypothetical protein [Cytobacillus stercorigallinarum]MBD7937782.1 hypothetical protein [Cytobacillus stercorigallinarum]